MIFSRNLILLVTHMALIDSKPRRIHNYSLPTDQPRPVVADVLFHTSQLSLAIHS